MRQGNKQHDVFDDCDHFRDSDVGGDGGDGDGPAGLVDSPAPPHPPVVRTIGDCAVVELTGEIDLFAFQRMAPLIDAVAAGPYRVVVMDLTGTTFFDCSGLSLLVRAHRRATERGGRAAVVCRHRLTLHVLGLSGLADAVVPVATVEEALRLSP